MANTIIEFLSLTGLSQYDSKIKEFIEAKVSEGDAKSFKYVNLVNGVLKFYTVNPITEDTVADFEIVLPEQDLSNLMALVKDATVGNIATFGENGQVVDSGIAVADLATKAEVGENKEAIEALAELVGELPETATATDIVGYVQEKTSGIATSENLAELTGRVAQAEVDIENIEKDYLKAADKQELEGKINAAQAKGEEALAKAEEVAADLATEAEAREAADKANAEAIAAIKEDVDAFFKDADMTESAKDTLKELQEYIASDETGAAAMAASIKENTDAIAAEAEKVATLQTEMDAVEGAVATKAEQSALAEEIAAREAADALKADKADLEAANAEIAKKANQTALNEEVAAREALDARVVVVEGKAHEHANADILDGITAEKVAAWDAAKADAIADAEAKNAALETALKNADVELLAAAKEYADSKVEGVDLSGIATNAADIDKLEAKDTEIEGNVTALQEDVASLKEIQHVEITTEQINALFETV